MAEINTLFVTYNCGRELINTDYFSATLSQSLSSTAPLKHPDIIALSIQEIAPISYSFLGGSFLSPYFDRLSSSILQTTKSWDPSSNYEILSTNNLGMTALMLFTTSEFKQRVTGIQTAGTGIGVMEMGNKGAVGARVGYRLDDGQETSLTFVAAHLAPHEPAWEQRNADWRSINENLVFTRIPEAESTRSKRTNGEISADEDGEIEPLISSTTDNQETEDGQDNAMMIQYSHLFFGGDLNYRTSDLKPHPDDYKSWPQPQPSSDTLHVSSLFEKDQLTREKAANKTLHKLSEAKVGFPPTYKFSEKGREMAQQSADSILQQGKSSSSVRIPEEEHWYWAQHRNPSWCDRILYFLPGVDEPKVYAYKSLALQPTSDHKPVVLQIGVPKERVKGEDGFKAPFKIREGWQERRKQARRKEVVVGLVAYLVLTWEGRVLLLGAVVAVLGGVVALRSLG